MEQLFVNNNHITYIFHYKYIKKKHKTKTYYRYIKNYGSKIFFVDKNKIRYIVKILVINK